MKPTEMYSINIENKSIVLRLNSNLVDEASLAKLLDYLELESIRKRSLMTNNQAAALGEEIDRAVWKKIEERIERA